MEPDPGADLSVGPTARGELHYFLIAPSAFGACQLALVVMMTAVVVRRMVN